MVWGPLHGLKRIFFRSPKCGISFWIWGKLDVFTYWATSLVEIFTPRAAIVAILRGDPSGFIHWLGVQCSTWVSTSRGSTGRSAANPHGLLESDCVSFANLMACRRWCLKGCSVATPHSIQPMFCILGETVVSALSLSRVALLCLLTVALNGTWVIEQPRSSLLMLHNRMSQLLSHFKVGLPKLDQFILILHDLSVLQYDNFQSLMRLPT